MSGEFVAMSHESHGFCFCGTQHCDGTQRCDGECLPASEPEWSHWCSDDEADPVRVRCGCALNADHEHESDHAPHLTSIEQGTRVAHVLGMTNATVNGVPIPDHAPPAVSTQEQENNND